MYYISNKNNQIIAADSALLELFGLKNVEELLSKVILEELTFNQTGPDEITISSNEENHNFSLQSETLSTLIGDLQLNQLSIAQGKVEEVEEQEEQEEILPFAKTQEEELPSLAFVSTAAAVALESSEAEESDEEFDLEAILKEAQTDEIDLNTIQETAEEDTVEASLMIGSEDLQEPLVSEKAETIETLSIGSEEDYPFMVDEEPVILTEEPALSEGEETVSIEEPIQEEEEATFISILDESPLTIEEETPSVSDEDTSSSITIMDDELIGMLESDDISFEESNTDDFSLVETPEAEEEPLISLIEEEAMSIADETISLTEEAEETLSLTGEESTPSESAWEEEESFPIVIDITHVSKIIGITPEEYRDFFNEFIDTSLSFERDLKSEDAAIRAAAIQALSQISDALHIPTIAQTAQTLSTASSDEIASLIEKFYNKLSRISIQESQEEEKIEAEQEPELQIETQPETTEPEAQIEIQPETTEPEAVIEEAVEEIKDIELPEGSFGMLTQKDLDEVRPIRFDFRLEEAAGELSLPVELIEEFVNDFVEQARTETVKMLEAYRKGDLDTIQKIGHLLKGASSNLRINPLSDTLYEIQFCEDSSQLERLIKNYWAHFISFEKQMQLLSK